MHLLIEIVCDKLLFQIGLEHDTERVRNCSSVAFLLGPKHNIIDSPVKEKERNAIGEIKENEIN